MTGEASKNPASWALVGDIGGTNCRLAAIDLSRPESVPEAVRVYDCAEYGDVSDAVLEYMVEKGVSAPPQAMVLAVAGPVEQNSIRFTNNSWAFSGNSVANVVGAKWVDLINDFTALSYALPAMTEADLFSLGGSEIKSIQEQVSVSAVLGPGTGLGVGGLVQKGDIKIPLSTEGGHVSFAPATDLEIEIARELWKRFDRLSNERLLSGSGIYLIYSALSKILDLPLLAETEVEVTAGALAKNDPLAKEAMDCFCGILGSVAGDVALLYGAQAGVYIAGGIAPRITDYLAKSSFRERFENKGRFKEYLAAIRCDVITHSFPALIGCREHLFSQISR